MSKHLKTLSHQEDSTRHTFSLLEKLLIGIAFINFIRLIYLIGTTVSDWI